MKRRAAVAALLASAVSAAPPTVPATDAGRAWWSHVGYLADDSLEGRKAGTEGHKKAARYVAEQFAKAGLKPAGTKGYLQPVSFRVRQLVENNCSAEIVGTDGKAQPLTLGKDAYVQARGKSGRVVEAGLVFVGNGLVIPEAGVDDLKGLDLKGKIAIVMRGAPKNVDPALAQHASSAAELWKTLHAAGAIGVASLFNPTTSDIPWERTVLSRNAPTLTLSAPELNETTTQQAGMVLHPTAADRLFEGTGHTTVEILNLAKAHEPLPHFAIPSKVRIKATFTEKSTVSDNVLAVLPGSDPALKNEYVVYSAHLDHLGVGASVPTDPSDKIYNGAMDNASGIASLIETAKSMKDKPLKRSVLFAAVTGEESGLLGSKYLANKPTVPKSSIVADINVDMFLPIIPLKAITVFGIDESSLGTDFKSVAEKFGVPTARDPEPARQRFTRSDQYSFIRTGVPALSFKFHADLGTPEGDVLAKWTKERYHAPSDDLKQPVNIDGAVKFNEVIAAFLQYVADNPQRPHWNDTSFFKRFSK